MLQQFVIKIDSICKAFQLHHHVAKKCLPFRFYFDGRIKDANSTIVSFSLLVMSSKHLVAPQSKYFLFLILQSSRILNFYKGIKF